MTDKRVLLIGNTKSKSTKRLITEAHARGIVFDVIPDYALVYENDVITLRKKELPHDVYSYDVYYFRGIARDEKRKRELHTIAKHLHENGKRVVEKILTEDVLPDDSEVPASVRGLYALPETEIIARTGIDAFLDKVTFPVVIKKFSSSQGKGVLKAESREEIKNFVIDEDSFIGQKFYTFPFDTRVLVVGGTIVGGLNRYRKEGEDFLTTKYGGKREAAILSSSARDAVLEVVLLKRLEIAGVDIFVQDDTVYVIEVNESPQFNVFSKYAGINAAATIIDYLIQ